MFVVHATKKLLDRLASATLVAPQTSSTTTLGSWYATLLFWRPQVALLVNESTLLPVLMPLAPAATLPERLPASLAAHGVGEQIIAAELVEMEHHELAKTANRSVVGMMNEFAFLAGAFRDGDSDPDLAASRTASPLRRAVRCTAATSAPTGSSLPGSARRRPTQAIE